MHSAGFAIYMLVATWTNSHGYGYPHVETLTEHIVATDMAADQWPPRIFQSKAVCDRYRNKLVAAWVADPEVPFHAADILASACAPFAPDPRAGAPV